MICSIFAEAMKNTMLLLLVISTIALFADNLSAKKIERQDLGRGVKMTILVDKVMQPQARWTTEEWMVKGTAEAGFNVFSPRRGHDRLDEVRQVTEWRRKYGIYHMPWMRGSLVDPDWWTDYGHGPDYGPYLWDSVRAAQQAHPDRLWLY
jgi:hypothetical protein